MSSPGDWRFRGYLPHFDNGAVAQLITYRLADALPGDAVARLRERAADDRQLNDAIERYADRGHGSCVLRLHHNARIVADAWKHFDGLQYRLLAWVIMPNHVHVLIEPISSFPLSRIVHSQKSFTSKAILRLAGGTPALPEHRVWQREYFDRFIRNPAHFESTVRYVHENPVKAGLVGRACAWPWSSASIPPSFTAGGIPTTSVH